MQYSIVTPSFQNLEWLKLCAASVADQDVESEHIVQDAGSTDGTLDWIQNHKEIQFRVEKDDGMYDAVNRGLKTSSGTICAYLNCDEQYLPGALARVETFFQNNPDVELVFGDAIVVGRSGEFLCQRKSLIPQLAHSLVSENLSILTCATFFRRSLFEKRGLWFNPKMRQLGDAEWLVRCIQQKVPMRLLNQFTSVFTLTGANLSMRCGGSERSQLTAAAPWWLRKSKPLIIAHHRMRKLVAGHYFQSPFQYEIFTRDSVHERVLFDVARPTGRFPAMAFKS